MKFTKIMEPHNRESFNNRSWMNRYPLNAYWTENAKRETICKVCDNEILQNSQRIALIKNNRYSGRALQYFHINCFDKYKEIMDCNPIKKLNELYKSINESKEKGAPDFIINDLKEKRDNLQVMMIKNRISIR